MKKEDRLGQVIRLLRFLGSGEYRKECNCGDCQKVPDALQYAIKVLKEFEGDNDECIETCQEITLLKEQIKELKQRELDDEIFIKHIQSHLQEGQKVICKICGKTVEEIATAFKEGKL